MERKRKLRSLDAWRRKLPHCTAAALACILAAVIQDGVPDMGHDRNNYRKARNAQTLETETPYGPILQHTEMLMPGDIPKQVPIAHPFAMLYEAVSRCSPFAVFFLDRLRDQPPTPERPWKVVLYTDEVVPGNPMATLNARKFQAVYWSFLEIGVHALMREEAWFTVMTEFSLVINQLQAGLSQAVGQIIKLFWGPEYNFQTTGMNLPYPGECIRMWATLGGIIQDGGAHKSTWHSRGDGASKFCLLCKNLFDYESEIVDEDGEHLLVSNIIEFKDLIKENSADLRAKVRWLERQSTIVGMTVALFTEYQQGLGLTHKRKSILLDRTLDHILDPVEAFIHDWMHCLFVDGVCNLTVYLLFEAFIKLGHTGIYGIFADFNSNWIWPSKWHRNKRNQIFAETNKQTHRKVKHIKAQAQDLLTMMPVLAYFTQIVLMRMEPTLNAQCETFLALANIVELIVACGRGNVSAPQLLTAVETFLALFAAAWGFRWMVPKFHWLLHLPTILENWAGVLLNCFCLERKHRVPKRYAKEIENISKRANESLLSEVICHHLGQLSDPESFKFETGLVHPKKPSRAVTRLIQERLGVDDSYDVKVSAEARFSRVATCKKDDVVIFKDGDDSFRVGKVLLHFEVDSVPISMLEVFDCVRRDTDMCRAVWRTRGQDDYKMIDTDEIMETVVYSLLNVDGLYSVLMPPEFR